MFSILWFHFHIYFSILNTIQRKLACKNLSNYFIKSICKHKISQLQKIKQLKRNMVCKYKFVLMNQSLFQFFYKRILSDSIFIKLDSNKRFSWLLLEDGLNGLHNRSLALSLLEIYCSSSSSIPLNVLQVLQRFFKFFKDSWDRISL